MPELSNLFLFLQNDALTLLTKLLILLLIFIYIIFTLIVISRVKTLNRTISLKAARASSLMKIASITFLLLALFLFIAALVIV
jgi:hypothetical protein